MATAKEKRQIRAMEIRIEELERHFKIANKAGVDTFTELFETRSAMRRAYEAICEAEKALRECMQNDPAFMQTVKEIQADF